MNSVGRGGGIMNWGGGYEFCVEEGGTIMNSVGKVGGGGGREPLTVKLKNYEFCGKESL